MTKMGRTEIPINWDEVDLMLQAGCTGIEIAGYFHMHEKTLYQKFPDIFGITFTEYAQRKCSRGCARLKVKTFEKSIKGDNQQLTLNLKNRCGYSDKQEYRVETDGGPSIWIKETDGKSKDLVNAE